MHTIRLDANSRRSRIRRKWCCPSSLFAFLPSTGDAVSVLWASSILTHDSRSHPYFIHREKWLVGEFFFKRKAKFNRSRTTPWSRFDTDLREVVSWKHASKERGDTITKWSRSSGGRKEPHAQQPSQALFRPTGEPCHQFTASDVSLACSIQGNRCELYKPVT